LGRCPWIVHRWQRQKYIAWSQETAPFFWVPFPLSGLEHRGCDWGGDNTQNWALYFYSIFITIFEGEVSGVSPAAGLKNGESDRGRNSEKSNDD
jgi:hypothetical protein